MVESRCGIRCNECDWREKVNCAGCLHIDKPFWGDSCSVKDCCEAKGYDFCGQCPDFPCAILTEMSYAKVEGDNGRRIRTCVMWAAGFDAERFIAAVSTQNAEVLQGFFTPDAIIRWHDSNEQFTVAEYIRANCEYPGNWNGEFQRVEKSSIGITLLTKIFSDDFATFVTAFITLKDGKITHLDEYYADYNSDVPKWRKDMNIGRPISQ